MHKNYWVGVNPKTSTYTFHETHMPTIADVCSRNRVNIYLTQAQKDHLSPQLPRIVSRDISFDEIKASV